MQEKEGESVGVVRDISFVSPSVRIELSETIRKSVAEQQDEREEEEKGTDKISPSRFRLSLQYSGFHRKIKYLLYNV